MDNLRKLPVDLIYDKDADIISKKEKENMMA